MALAHPEVIDDTTRRLVDAAAEVFAEKGYDGAGVAEIARRAGLTTGAIYSRFSGKAELLAEAIRLHTADEFDQLFAQDDAETDTRALLNRVGLHLVTRSPHSGSPILLEAFVAARRDPEVRAVLAAHLAERAERLRGLVDAGKAAGSLDPTLDTAAMVHFAHAVGLGFLLYEALGSEHPSPVAWRDLIARIVSSLDPTYAASTTARTSDKENHHGQ